MEEALTSLLKSIKNLEQAVAKNKDDAASRAKLVAELGKLQNLKEGTLSYMDITTEEAIKKTYGIDVGEYFDQLDEKDMELKGASNPGDYAWLQADIRLVIIERTPKNEKIARLIVEKIISALRKKGGN